MLNGYQSTEEQSTTVRDVQKSHIGNGNLQSVPKEDSNRYSRGAFRPQSTASGGQRNTIRTEGRQGTVLSTESGEQKVNTTNGEADFSESAFSMDEDGVSQSGAKGITEPDISKDTRSHEERVAEMMGGKESQKVKGRKFVQSIGKALGVTVVFEDTVEKYGEWSDGYIDKNGVIHIDYNNKNPLAFLFRHEMVHYGSGSKFYNQFVKLAYNSKLFKEWLQEKTKMPEGTSVDRMAAKYMTMVAESRKGVEELSETRLQEEMVADFAGSDLFTAGGSGLAAMSTEFDTKQRNVVSQYIADVISWLKKKINKVPGAENLTFELSRLEDTFNRMISDAKQNPTERELKHSIAGVGANINDNMKYYQNYIENLPVDEYNKLTTKKPIKVTRDVWSAVNSARTSRYSGLGADNIPILDIINLGEYGVLDTNDYYFIRNSDKYNFSVIKHSKTLKGRKNNYDEYGVGIRPEGKGTFGRTDNDNESAGFEGGDDTSNRYNGPSADQRAPGKNVKGAQRVGKTDGRTGVGEGADNFGRRIENDQAELNDSAFSMPENIRRSIPVDTNTDADVDTDNDIIADFQKLNNEFNKGNIEEEIYMQRVAELYEEIVKKHGRIKPGEVGKTKYQDIPVPKRIDKKTKVQRHVRTVLEGGELTDEMVSTVKADILSGEFNYTPTSNKKNIAYAEDAVMKGAAVGIWERARGDKGTVLLSPCL